MAKRKTPAEAHETSTARPTGPQTQGVASPPARAAQPKRKSVSRAPAERRTADASTDATRSESMGSEPSEEDIRLRAYQRYLERGAGDGRHFEDWLAAEDELKKNGR